MNDWTTILTFVYPHEAHIAKGILESENIPVQIRDELTAQVNNFYSNAIGGVKLLVRKNDYKKAYEILVKSGYITEEKKSKNRFWIWFDKTSSKLPFIGNSILELRLMIVATLIIILITIPVVLLMLPSTIEKLTENNWCVDKIYYNGKEINYNSGEIALESEKLTLTINGIGNCNETMNFSENGIVDFEQESLLSYIYPHCLKQMVFSGNRFSLTQSPQKIREFMILCRNLTNLELFDLSYNPLSYNTVRYIHNSSYYGNADDGVVMEQQTLFHMSNFYLPPKLRTLRLSHFLSKQGYGGSMTIYNVANLRHLDVSYFQLENFPNVFFNGSNSIEYIDLSGISSMMYASKGSIPLFQKATTVKLLHAGLARALVNPGDIFKFVPLVEDLDISFNNLLFLRPSVFQFNKRIMNLSIQFNWLSDIPLAITSCPHLTSLNVKNNSIITINSTLCNWIDGQFSKTGTKFKLYLSGNKLECICDTKNFIEWIVNSDVDFDQPDRNYPCRLANGTFTWINQVYADFHNVFHECDSATWLRVGIGLLAAFAALVFPLALIVNFRWRIAYWIYCRFQRVIKNKIKHKFKYDIYVSYADDSVNWVKNVLATRLERSWGLQLCLEDRDILCGEIKSDAILNSISDSRNIIFVVTDSFASKTFSSFEIERAKYEKYSGDLQQIIVIRREVLIENFPPELDCIQRDITSIDWSEEDCEYGWDKLRMALFAEFI